MRALDETCFLPGPEEGVPDGDGQRLALVWLLRQRHPVVVLVSPGQRLSRSLHAAIRVGHLPVATPQRMQNIRWEGAAVLALSVDRTALDAIERHLCEVRALCFLGLTRDQRATWCSAHGARKLSQVDSRKTGMAPLDPVVVVALEHAMKAINVSSELIADAERAYVVLTLQELKRTGHVYDVDALMAWATAHGWFPGDTPRLRDVARGVLDGKRFVLRKSWGPTPETAQSWERAAANAHEPRP